jgi:hypothetical protein
MVSVIGLLTYCFPIITGTGITQSIHWLGCGLDGPDFDSRQLQEIISAPKHPVRRWGPHDLTNSMDTGRSFPWG